VHVWTALKLFQVWGKDALKFGPIWFIVDFDSRSDLAVPDVSALGIFRRTVSPTTPSAIQTYMVTAIPLN
jgi:hypothetical protein